MMGNKEAIRKGAQTIAWSISLQLCLWGLENEFYLTDLSCRGRRKEWNDISV
jgi:hypothetical protein